MFFVFFGCGMAFLDAVLKHAAFNHQLLTAHGIRSLTHSFSDDIRSLTTFAHHDKPTIPHARAEEAPATKNELLRWLADTLNFAASPHLLSVRVEDCATGALHAQLLDSLQARVS